MTVAPGAAVVRASTGRAVLCGAAVASGGEAVVCGDAVVSTSKKSHEFSAENLEK